MISSFAKNPLGSMYIWSETLRSDRPVDPWRSSNNTSQSHLFFIEQFNSANKVNSTCRSYITRSIRSTIYSVTNVVYTSLPQRCVKPHAARPIRKCLAATKLPGHWGNCVSSVFFFFFLFSSNFTFDYLLCQVLR